MSDAIRVLRCDPVRYLITGATGFVGSALARQLVAARHDVHAVVRAPDRASALRELGVALHTGDVTQVGSLRDVMRGVDGVFHVAGWYEVGTRDKRAGELVNVEGTRNVLRAARELAVPKVVYTSTLAVFGDTHGRLVDESRRADGPFLSEYDRTKWRAHYEVAEPAIREGLPLVIVQPGVVYGPGDRGPFYPLWQRFLKGRLPAVPAGSAYCWGHVDDMARGHVLAMERGRSGESYIIAGPAHTLVEAFEIASAITGLPAPRPLPPGLLRAGARVLELLGRDAEALRVMAGATYLGSSAKAQRELGFSTRTLEEGLRETLSFEMDLLRRQDPRSHARAGK